MSCLSIACRPCCITIPIAADNIFGSCSDTAMGLFPWPISQAHLESSSWCQCSCFTGFCCQNQAARQRCFALSKTRFDVVQQVVVCHGRPVVSTHVPIEMGNRIAIRGACLDGDVLSAIRAVLLPQHMKYLSCAHVMWCAVDSPFEMGTWPSVTDPRCQIRDIGAVRAVNLRKRMPGEQ